MVRPWTLSVDALTCSNSQQKQQQQQQQQLGEVVLAYKAGTQCACVC
jgi:hypothetical protein